MRWGKPHHRRGLMSRGAFAHATLPQGYSFANAEAAAYVAAMSVEPDDTRKALIDTLVGALKSGSVWNSIGILCLCAAHDSQASRLNVKTASVYMGVVGTPTFTVDKGWNTPSGSHRLTGGELYTSSGGLFTYTAQHHGCWSDVNAANPSNRTLYVQDDQFQYQMNPRNSSDIVFAESADQQVTGGTGVSAVGWTLVTRGANEGLYRDNSLLSSTFVGSQGGQSNRSWRALSDVFSNSSPHRLCAFTAGGNLTTAQMTAYYNAVLAYMQGVGVA